MDLSHLGKVDLSTLNYAEKSDDNQEWFERVGLYVSRPEYTLPTNAKIESLKAKGE